MRSSYLDIFAIVKCIIFSFITVIIQDDVAFFNQIANRIKDFISMQQTIGNTSGITFNLLHL
jgi:hypothetical protein